MKPALTFDGFLPDSEAEYRQLQQPRYTHCVDCCKPFSSTNTHSAAGWRETQLSAMCEDCFDELFSEDE